jgi:DNA repair ATPase RecN
MEKNKTKFDLSFNKATLDMNEIEETAKIAVFNSMKGLRNLTEELMNKQQEAFSSRYMGNFGAYSDKLQSIKSNLEQLEMYSKHYARAITTLYNIIESLKRDDIELQYFDETREELSVKKAA